MTPPEIPLTASGIQRKLSALEREQMALLAEQETRLQAAAERDAARTAQEAAPVTFRARYSGSRGGSSRLLEDVAFCMGLFLIGGKGTIEMMQEAGRLPHADHSFMTVLVEFLRSSLLIVPKMLGKSTGGAVWGSIGSGIGKIVGRGGKPGRDDDASPPRQPPPGDG
jgi:hypothetical protein